MVIDHQDRKRHCPRPSGLGIAITFPRTINRFGMNPSGFIPIVYMVTVQDYATLGDIKFFFIIVSVYHNPSMHVLVTNLYSAFNLYCSRNINDINIPPQSTIIYVSHGFIDTAPRSWPIPINLSIASVLQYKLAASGSSAMMRFGEIILLTSPACNCDY